MQIYYANQIAEERCSFEKPGKDYRKERNSVKNMKLVICAYIFLLSCLSQGNVKNSIQSFLKKKSYLDTVDTVF